MWFRAVIAVLLVLLAPFGAQGVAAEAGNPAALGKELFKACVACHSIEPGRHMTGPSLASIWGRKAGTVEGFTRYSDALKQADVIWDEPSLDAWLANPKTFIPGNRMTFHGIPEEARRLDLIAYLRLVSEEDPAQRQEAEGTTGGMMGQGQPLDLKALEANNRITSIAYCGDTYTVAAETGEAYVFWEFNLRFKTDGSDLGPLPGHPVIIPSGMSGDRASVIFASPGEISAFIEKTC
jgi:cytochrome c